MDATREFIRDTYVLFPWQISSDSTHMYYYNAANNKMTTKSSVILVDAISQDDWPAKRHLPDTAIKLYNAPVYPYIPYSTINSVTEYTFAHGGMAICTSPTNIVLFADELVPLTFTNFVGVLPVGPGVEVTADTAFYATNYS